MPFFDLIRHQTSKQFLFYYVGAHSRGGGDF